MKIGVALGSGAAKGFAHIAYLQAIDELGLEVSCISGTSMGAFIGAFYAGGMPAKDIYNLVTEFGILNMPKVLTFSRLPKAGLIHGEKIEDFLRKNLPVQNFEELKIPMKISATNYWDKNEYVFEKGDIVPAIRSSISIPGVFKPYYYQGKLFLDGALVNPVPFDLLLDADFIVAVDVIGGQFQEGNKFPTSTIDVINSSFQIMKKGILEQKGYKDKIDIYCTPDLRKFRSFAFHKSKEIIHAVKQDVDLFKKDLQTSCASPMPLSKTTI